MVETIRRLCKEQGKNLFTLEKECGLGNGSVNKWDRSSPSVAKVSTVAKALGVSVSDLIGEQQEKPTPVSEDGLDPELVTLIKRIPADRMPEVERYLRFQAEQGEKP